MNTILEVKNSDRNYLFLCDVESPLGEVHDALSQMKAHVVKLMAEAEAKSKEEEYPAPEVVD